MAGEKILVVEDEVDISRLVAFNLRLEGYETVEIKDGLEALRRVDDEQPDLIILDLMLPSLDGTGVCFQLKHNPATSEIPIIMLTAKTAEWDRLHGFELGADDYVVKPFSVRELVLRVRAVLNRAPSRSGGADVALGPVRVERESRRVFVEQREVSLTHLEFELLCYLLERPGRALTREALLEGVWGYHSSSFSRTVDTHIKRLREKLGSAASLIETVRGTGYRVREVNRIT